MCHPAVAVALAVASTVTSSINSSKQAKAARRSQTDAINAQNRALRESIERSKLFDEERRKTLDENINQFTPDKQKQLLDEQVANTEGSLSDLLQRANASKNAAGGIGGKVSNTFTIEDGQTQAKTASKAVNRNQLLARALSHNNLALRNSINNSNFATRFSEIGNAQRRRAKADQKVTEAAGIVKTPKTNGFLSGLSTALKVGSQVAGGFGKPTPGLNPNGGLPNAGTVWEGFNDTTEALPS